MQLTSGRFINSYAILPIQNKFQGNQHFAFEEILWKSHKWCSTLDPCPLFPGRGKKGVAGAFYDL